MLAVDQVLAGINQAGRPLAHFIPGSPQRIVDQEFNHIPWGIELVAESQLVTVARCRGCFASLVACLEDGGCVSIAADVGGSVPAMLAGKQVRISSASVALARLTDAPLFPSFLAFDSGRARVVTDAPLDPRQLGPEAMQTQLIQALDAHISANLLSWQMPLSLRRTRQW